MMAKIKEPLPKYRQIKEIIRQNIQSEKWKSGDIIPGEETLAKNFNCSRVTVHRSLRELAEEGLLERRRKAGTRVVVTSLRKAYLEIPRIRMEIEEKGASYRYALLLRQIKIPPASIRGKLEVVPKARALQLQCLHYSNETPFLLEDRWINLETVPEAKQESFVTIGPNDWLFEKVPWSTSVAEHIFSATNADERQAELLSLAERDALFLLQRRTWCQKKLVTYVRLYYPGRFYQMQTIL